MNTDLQTAIDLMQVPAESGHESLMSAQIRKALIELGVPESCMHNDETHRQSEYGGEIGNLIVRLDGHGRGPRRLLSTHLDAVPDVVGCKPKVAGERVVNGAPDRALGADARAGCACLLAAARALMDRRGNHGPRTLAFFVQEEVGLVGSRGLNVKDLGEPTPAMGFNFDGGDANEIANAVIGVERLNIRITGVPTHASRPQNGISAAVIAAEALAELQHEGWNGVIEKPRGRGTANLGILRGGKGSNVVMPDLYALAESRSFDREFRGVIIGAWREAFTRAVERNNERSTEAFGRASVAFTPGPIYDPYRLDESSETVRTTVAAMKKLGLAPRFFDHPGGMDSCHLVAKGIPTVGLGMGCRQAHSVEEWLDIPHFLMACRLAVELAAGE